MSSDVELAIGGEKMTIGLNDVFDVFATIPVRMTTAQRPSSHNTFTV